eukprot:scaffold34372_cov60-Phaeocystis_antarctica.AAC.2
MLLLRLSERGRMGRLRLSSLRAQLGLQRRRRLRVLLMRSSEGGCLAGASLQQRLFCRRLALR